MWIRVDGRLDQVRACGQWHQGFAKEGVGDIDKDVSYNHVLWFNTFLIRTQMDGKYCIGILYLFFICVMPSVYHHYSVRFYSLSIYLCIRILKNQNYGNKGILRKGDAGL